MLVLLLGLGALWLFASQSSLSSASGAAQSTSVAQAVANAKAHETSVHRLQDFAASLRSAYPSLADDLIAKTKDMATIQLNPNVNQTTFVHFVTDMAAKAKATNEPQRISVNAAVTPDGNVVGSGPDAKAVQAALGGSAHVVTPGGT